MALRTISPQQSEGKTYNPLAGRARFKATSTSYWQGQRVRILHAIDNTCERSRLGQEGLVVRIMPGGNLSAGETLNDLLCLVEFNDGERYVFWADELQPAGRSAGGRVSGRLTPSC